MIPAGDASYAVYPDTAWEKTEANATSVSHIALPVAITFCHRRGRATIFKSVITALGNPEYIRMLINPAERVVIVQACDRQERNAIVVPRNLHDDGVSFGINSVALHGLMTNLMGWSKRSSYRVRGELRAEAGLVMFLLDEAEVLDEANAKQTAIS